MLIATDRQVSDYQRLSEAKSDALRWQLWLVFIAGLALLAYSALRVLRPLIMQVRAAPAELESSGAALRHAMAENRLILDTTDDGMFGVDQAGRTASSTLPLPNCSGSRPPPGWAGPPPGHSGR